MDIRLVSKKAGAREENVLRMDKRAEKARNIDVAC
jgi:hypothetical protein